MSLVRTNKQENPFVQIDKYFFEDKNLSWAAKGVLGYILSKPNNWQVRKEDLIRRSGDGKARVEAALLNLMANGYINWYQEVNYDGTFGEWIYEVFERPEFNPKKDHFIEEGKKRIAAKKAKTKERNAKRDEEKEPKVNNQLSESPKADYPTSDNPTSDNQPYNNNDLNNNDFNNNDLEEEEEREHQISELLYFYTKNISAIGKDLVANKLKEWLEILPYEVVKAELYNCALYGAKSWNYIQAALNDSNNQKIKTVEELEGKYKRFTSRKRSTKRQKKKPSVRKEKLPEWFPETGYEQKIEQQTEFTQDELEQLKNELASFNN
ncbi:DnaD domain protein [Bacillus sp. B15-48]|uniref:DnaD domain protein n=1 Tax=Bacillus sp. B15-48 TaxID=1548601 RepID=UPI00193FC71F|nr:DnaD domain protein [Bacillus sp. B15-48]MBM4765452.1 hypothetical protein [Bacillus sp. B15-48]